jgi:hypothetical protein
VGDDHGAARHINIQNNRSWSSANQKDAKYEVERKKTLRGWRNWATMRLHKHMTIFVSMPLLMSMEWGSSYNAH